MSPRHKHKNFFFPLQVLVLRLSLFLNVPCSSALSVEPRRLLILGFGRVGQAVANAALAGADSTFHDISGKFENIWGTVRATDLKDGDGVNVLPWGDRRAVRAILPQCTHVLITIPPHPDELVCDLMWLDLVNNLPLGAWVGFISTTGVYGDHGGEWVTEESLLLCPSAGGAAIYREAEAAWRARATQCGWRMYVFRCAGIYGPERSALHTVYKVGFDPTMPCTGKSGKSITNRIHEEDIARAIVSSMILPSMESEFRVYNLADDEPENRMVVMEFAANLLEGQGVAVRLPDRFPIPKSKRSSRRSKERKRVSNRRMQTELLGRIGGLKYPTYREGLQSILKDCSNPWMKSCNESS